MYPRLKLAVFPLLLAFAVAATSLPAASANAEPAPAAGSVTVANPKTEHITDPLGIDRADPRFSWQLSSTERAVEQAAYQILVSSTPGGSGDMWDSGRVESADNNDVTYSGAPLNSTTDYYWQVRVWDQTGAESPWSTEASFETAFLTSDEFGGAWVGSPNRRAAGSIEGTFWIWDDPNAASQIVSPDDTFFRRTFDLSATEVFSARMQFTADQYFELWVNGTLAMQSPEESTEAWRQLQIADISSLLLPGSANTIAVKANKHGAYGLGGNAGLLGRLDIDYVDDSTQQILTDEAWKTTRPVSGDEWIQTGFDDSAWASAARSVEFGQGPWQNGVSAASPSEALLRKEFTSSAGEIAKARVYVSGLGYYKLFINGDRVGNHELDPGFTAYDKTVLYSTYDVTDMVRADGAENAIGVSLGRGYFGQTFPDEWMRSAWHDDTKLRLVLEITYGDGTTQQVVSDQSWKSSEGPTTSDSVWMGENYDARREQPGWNDTAFDDAAWSAVTRTSEPGGELKSQLFPAIQVTDTLEHVDVLTPNANTIIYDFGAPAAGWAEVALTGPTGTTVQIGYGEKLKEDGTVNSNGGFFDVQQYRYTLKGEGEERYTPSYSYAGYRYVQVTVPDGVDVLDVIGYRVHTAVEQTGSFTSSDDLLNAYDSAQAETVLNNLHSIPTDTPMYEKRAYTADAFLTADSAIAQFDMQNFYENWLRTHRDDQTPQGTFGNTVPGTVGAKEAETDPLWSSSYVLIAWQLFQYYGNTEVLEHNYEGMSRWMNYYRDVLDASGDGLYRGFSYGDWLDPTPGIGSDPYPGINLSANAYIYKTADIMTQIADLLGHETDAEEYRTFVAGLKESFNAAFYDAEGGFYIDKERDGYRQSSNLLPLSFGLVDDSQVERVVQNLVNDVEERGDHLSTGAIGTKEILPILTKYGYADLAYKVATNPTYPGWGYWFVELGAQTMWEEWGANSRSLDHAFFGTVDDWLFQYVAGIQPGAPGYDVVKIQPFPGGDLSSASASVNTPHGDVSSSWEQGADAFTLSVSIPAGATAEVFVPVTEDEVATVDSETGAELVGTADGFAQFAVGSGQYTFTTGPDNGENPGPTDPVAPDPSTFTAANKNLQLPAQASPGETITVRSINVEDGEDAHLWLFSDPVRLGQCTITATATSVTIPAGTPLGDHRVAATSLSGTLLGWGDIEIVSSDQGPGGSDGDGNGQDKDKSKETDKNNAAAGGLAVTGANLAIGTAVVLLLVAGVSLSVMSLRGRRRNG